MIRIAWARLSSLSSLEGPASLMRGGPLDGLLLAGGRDVVQTLIGLLPELRRRRITVLASLDEGHPRKAAEVLLAAHPAARIAAVQGHALEQAALGAALPAGLTSIGVLAPAALLARATAAGAEVVLAGAALPESLAAALALHRFGWAQDDYCRLAGAAVAGHILAAGPLACGGGAGHDWQTLSSPATIDGPVAELEPDGSCTITRHAASGGEVSPHSVVEALLDGIGDPRAVETPDCRIDLARLSVRATGPDRVRVAGAAGLPPASGLAAVRAKSGWRVTAVVVCPAPAALEKAYAADRLLRERASLLSLPVDEIHSEFLGAGADAGEVVWRAAIGCPSAAAAQLAVREIDAVIRRGPPGVFAVAGAGAPCVEEIITRSICPIPASASALTFEVLS